MGVMGLRNYRNEETSKREELWTRKEWRAWEVADMRKWEEQHRQEEEAYRGKRGTT